MKELLDTMQNLTSRSLVSTTLCNLAMDSLAVNHALNKFGFLYSWETGATSHLIPMSPVPNRMPNTSQGPAY